MSSIFIDCNFIADLLKLTDLYCTLTKFHGIFTLVTLEPTFTQQRTPFSVYYCAVNYSPEYSFLYHCALNYSPEYSFLCLSLCSQLLTRVHFSLSIIVPLITHQSTLFSVYHVPSVSHQSTLFSVFYCALNYSPE